MAANIRGGAPALGFAFVALAAGLAMILHTGNPPASPDHACRFWGVIGAAPNDSIMAEQLFTGSHSLAALGNANPDGWGLAFHSPALEISGWAGPLILRGGPPANHPADNRFRVAVSQMLDLDPRAAVAHVRLSTSGHNGIPNPHPFWRDDVALVHNGTLDSGEIETLLTADDPGYFEAHPSDYSGPRLDSELLLMYILKLRDLGVECRGGFRSHRIADAVREAVLHIYVAGGILTAANCIVMTADTLCAVRFDINNADRYKVHYRQIPGAWVVASEPVGSDTTGWSWLPEKHLGVFTVAAAPEISSVFPPTPYVIIDDVTVDDDLDGDSAGNNDGGCDAGEQIELIVRLRNEGGEAATNVRAALTTADSLCQIIDGHEEFGDLGPGAQAVCMDDFDFAIDPQCPDDHVLAFTLAIEADGQSGWEQEILLSVAAPVITPITYAVGDTINGNGNGRVDPGETFELRVTLENAGGEHATGLLATLTVDHPWVTILQGSASLDTLPANGPPAALPPFMLALDPACPDPDMLAVQIAISADWEQSAEIQFSIPVGGFFDDMESGPGSWTSYLVTPGYVNQWHLSQLRNFTPDGQWSWKFGDVGAGEYADLSDGALESEPVPLSAHSILRFRHWLEAEVSGSYPGYCFDGAMVEMSVSDGPWTQIHPVGGYPYLIRPGGTPGPWPEETPVYSGDIDWEEALFEISGYTEETACFRFRFGSDGAVTREGWYIDDVEIYGGDLGGAAAGDLTPLILRPAIDQNRPNPFSGRTAITYRMPVGGPVQIRIIDSSGRQVRAITNDAVASGSHTLFWDGRDAAGHPVPSGSYFIRFSGGGVKQVRKLQLIR